VFPAVVNHKRPTAVGLGQYLRELSFFGRVGFGRSRLSRRLGDSEVSTRVRKVLAVASGGGHWVQLQRLRPALVPSDVVFVTTDPGYASEVAPHRMHLVTDAARDKKLALVRLAFQMAVILMRERPDVVISTGAAPGYFALRLGRLFGARTIWIDSIANVDEMSLAGKLAKRYADLWLTQWPHLAGDNGPQFAGAVL
jgi:UDP-N-acetylglucosamine:LPS N-acetylglucosamine transferase